jgi:hypothetical protein
MFKRKFADKISENFGFILHWRYVAIITLAGMLEMSATRLTVIFHMEQQACCIVIAQY